MFVYHYGHLSRAFAEVERDLVAFLDGLDGWAAAGYRDGEELRARIGLGGERSPIAKNVRLEVGPPLRGEDQTVIPLAWKATGAPGLFPAMDADLVIASAGPGLTQLALRGYYRPPLGTVGRALDRALLHRIVEAGVKGFLDRVAGALEAPRVQDQVPQAGER